MKANAYNVNYSFVHCWQKVKAFAYNKSGLLASLRKPNVDIEHLVQEK